MKYRLIIKKKVIKFIQKRDQKEKDNINGNNRGDIYK